MSRRNNATEPYVPRDPLLWRLINGCRFESLGCAVVFLWMLVTTPLFPVLIVQQKRRRAWFHRALAEQSRTMTWREFLDHARHHSGTLIAEVGNKRRSRFWWSPDQIRDKAPVQPPLFSELSITVYGGAQQHPFRKWCYQHYLSLETGTALWVDFSEADFETFPFARDYDQQLQRRFPHQEVIVVTYYDVRYA